MGVGRWRTGVAGGAAGWDDGFWWVRVLARGIGREKDHRCY